MTYDISVFSFLLGTIGGTFVTYVVMRSFCKRKLEEQVMKDNIKYLKVIRNDLKDA